jgi:hypothetical protein
MLNSTHLEPAQTLTEFLAKLHVHFPLAHDMFAKFLSCETVQRKARFLLGAPLRRRLHSCRSRPVSSFA